MRRLIWAVLAVSGLWGGYWFVGATVLERSLRGWLVSAAPGMSAADADVAGFPNRFDVTLTDPRAGTAEGVIWQTPFLQIFALSYRPWHLIAAFAPEQTLTLPDGTALTLSADKLQASLVVTPWRAVALERIVVAGDGLALRAAGPLASLQTLRLSTRLDPARADTHRIGLELAGLRPDPALRAALPDRALPQGDAALHLDAFVRFSAPLDRFARETFPLPVLIEIRKAHLVWGDIRIEASGLLTPDAAGLAEGQLDLTLAGWDTALGVAVASGAMQPGIAATWAELARRLAAVSPTPDLIDLPLVFAKGRMRLGPLPLGLAPRLLP